MEVVAIFGAKALKLVAYVSVGAILHECVIVVSVDNCVSVNRMLEKYTTMLHCGGTGEGEC